MDAGAGRISLQGSDLIQNCIDVNASEFQARQVPLSENKSGNDVLFTVNLAQPMNMSTFQLSFDYVYNYGNNYNGINSRKLNAVVQPSTYTPATLAQTSSTGATNGQLMNVGKILSKDPIICIRPEFLIDRIHSPIPS